MTDDVGTRVEDPLLPGQIAYLINEYQRMHLFHPMTCKQCRELVRADWTPATGDVVWVCDVCSFVQVPDQELADGLARHTLAIARSPQARAVYRRLNPMVTHAWASSVADRLQALSGD